MTQITIIGAGVVGATIAYELSCLNRFDLTLVDQSTPASGSTGAALGVLMGAISQKTGGRAWHMRQRSLQRYQTLIGELEALTGLDLPYNRSGILKLLYEGENLKKWHSLAQKRNKQGWKIEIWSLSQLENRCHWLNLDGVVAAVYSPQDGQVNPTAFTEALITGAKINGVDCRWGEKVQNFVFTDPDEDNLRHCLQVKTQDAAIDTDWLIVAAGLGSTPLTTALSQTLDIRPVVGQAMELKLAQPLTQNWQPVITAHDVHIVPLNPHRYWIGATVEFPSETAIPPQSELLQQLKQEAIAFCPPLAEATVIHSWWGKRPRPYGRPAPIIEKLPGYSNVLVATAHYRNGVLLAPATAAEILQLIQL